MNSNEFDACERFRGWLLERLDLYNVSGCKQSGKRAIFRGYEREERDSTFSSSVGASVLKKQVRPVSLRRKCGSLFGKSTPYFKAEEVWISLDISRMTKK